MTPDGDLRRRGRVAAVVVAPAALSAALLAHPFISGRLPNEVDVAAEVAAGTTSWAWVHLAAGLASALVAVAFLAARSYLREAGEERYSPLGTPLAVVGSTLFAILPGMEFVPLAAARTGASTAQITEAQDAITPWFVAVLAVSALTFAAGVLLFAAAVAAARVAGTGLTTVLVAALALMAVARFVPLSVSQFYVESVAALVALWSLAYLMTSRPVPRPAPALRAQPEGL